jgi:hypothetical protein
MFSNNTNNKKTNSVNGKEMFWDYLGLLGKTFMAGAAVVGAVKAVKGCIEAEKDFDKKYLDCLK